MPMGVPRIDAVSVPVRAERHAQDADAHLHPARREHPQLPADLHGRPQASGGARSDVVRPLDRPVGRRHARHRHRRLQRQVLVRSTRGRRTPSSCTRSSAGRGRHGSHGNKVTMEDPGAYPKPFTVTFRRRLAAPGDEIMEYICQENNQYRRRAGYCAGAEVIRGTGQREVEWAVLFGTCASAC